MSSIPDSEIRLVQGYIQSLKKAPIVCAVPAPLKPAANILNAAEFSWMLNDLLGTTGNHSAAFPFRQRDSYGFANKPVDFKHDPVFVENLYDTIEELVEKVAEVPGDAPQLFSCGNTDYKTESCRQTLVTKFAQRAFRRPLKSWERDSLMATMASEADLLNKMKSAYIHILMAPEFIFKLEEVVESQDFVIAGRLAALLWHSAPDDTLISLASSGALKSRSTLEQQVIRMLNDPKATRFIDGFVNDWLGINGLDSVMASESQLPSSLRTSMKTETILFMREVLMNRPIHEIVTAQYSYLNQELAQHYQVSGPTTATHQKVELPATSYRRGVLSQASILTLTYKGADDKRPVFRGNYVLGRLLCDSPKGEIPANTKTDLSDLPPNYTFKDILKLHRKKPDCAGCHQAMDPVGLAFDHFDGFGRYRTQYPASLKNLPVDTSESVYGQNFRSSYDLMDIIGASDKFYQCVTRYSYAYLVRPPDSGDDQCVVNDVAAQTKQNSLGFPAMIIKIVTSGAFLPN